MTFDPTALLTGMSTVGCGTVITVGIRIWRVLTRLEQRLHEHDMMWFDYCEKHNIHLSPVKRRFNGGASPG